MPFSFPLHPRQLSELYRDPTLSYHYDVSLPVFEDGSFDPDSNYRGRCTEAGCPCKGYYYDTGTGQTNIRCSVCDHTPLQHLKGRPPIPISDIERLRSCPYEVKDFDRPIGQTFTVKHRMTPLFFTCCPYSNILVLLDRFFSQIRAKFVDGDGMSSIANPHVSYECSLITACLFSLPFPFLCLA